MPRWVVDLQFDYLSRGADIRRVSAPRLYTTIALTPLHFCTLEEGGVGEGGGLACREFSD